MTALSTASALGYEYLMKMACKLAKCIAKGKAMSLEIHKAAGIQLQTNGHILAVKACCSQHSRQTCIQEMALMNIY